MAPMVVGWLILLQESKLYFTICQTCQMLNLPFNCMLRLKRRRLKGSVECE